MDPHGPALRNFLSRPPFGQMGSVKAVAVQTVSSWPADGEKNNQRIKIANELARRCARLAKIQMQAGGWVSIENPVDFLIWCLPAYKPLVKVLVKVVGDQCAFGGLWRKPTGWLTNAQWMHFLARVCPGKSSTSASAA